MSTEITIFWRDEEACYVSYEAQGNRGKLSADPESAVEALRRQRPELSLPPFEEWSVECDGTLFVEIPLVFWACGAGPCNAKGCVEKAWQAPRYCPECGEPVGHCDEHLD